MNEIIITGKARLMRRDDLKQRRKLVLCWPTNKGFLTSREIAPIIPLPHATLKTRIRRYGATDPRVTDPERLEKEHHSRLHKGGRKERKLNQIKVGIWEAANL